MKKSYISIREVTQIDFFGFGTVSDVVDAGRWSDLQRIEEITANDRMHLLYHRPINLDISFVSFFLLTTLTNSSIGFHQNHLELVELFRAPRKQLNYL